MGEDIIHLQLSLADLECIKEAISNDSLLLSRGVWGGKGREGREA